MIILKVIFGIILVVIFLILIVICAKITVDFSYLDEKISLKVRFLGINIDIIKIMDKFSKQKKQTVDKPKKEESKEKKEKLSVDDYLTILHDAIDILEEFAFSFTFKKIYATIKIATKDVANTGMVLGASWNIYSYITSFLRSNFIIKQYNVDIVPNWDEKNEVLVDTNIVIHTRIFRILKHLKYKKILEIRKRVNL